MSERLVVTMALKESGGYKSASPNRLRDKELRGTTRVGSGLEGKKHQKSVGNAIFCAPGELSEPSNRFLENEG
jgi:hypothetical protein